jgi:hypothetical protein
MKKTVYIVVLLSCIAAGFMAGRCTTTVETTREYVRGEPVSGSVPDSKPVTVESPAVSVLPVKTDTLFVDNIRYITQKVDTAAIIREYELKRYYATTLFDNKNGKLDISLTTQYNKLGDLTYTFTPVHIVETVKIKPVWTPFVSASYSTLQQVSVGGGVFYHDIGVQVRYVTDFKAKGLDLGVLYKF